MADKYIIKSANEPNPDLLSKAYADMYLALIKQAGSPEEMYASVLKALDAEAELKFIDSDKQNERHSKGKPATKI